MRARVLRANDTIYGTIDRRAHIFLWAYDVICVTVNQCVHVFYGRAMSSTTP